MAKSLNLCQFIGNVGQEPDIKFTASGSAVANLSLACSDDYKDKQTGQKVEQTNWIRVVAFGRLAEIIQEYVKKGSKIYIAGKQTTRKWQNQQGVDQYTTEIVASEMQMLDSRSDDAGGSAGAQANANAAGGQRASKPPHDSQQNAPAPAPQMDSDEDLIPF